MSRGPTSIRRRRARSAPQSPAARRAADPQRAREAERYAEPLPSRELVLQTLEEEAVPVDERRLAQLLGVGRKEADAFARRLGAMERDGQILRNRKGAILVAGKLDVVRGRVEAHPDGYGFVVPDDGGADLYLAPGEMRQVMHGDSVIVRPAGIDRRGRREGRIVEVIERAHARIVGRLHIERGVAFVAAADRRIQHDIVIEPGATGGAKPGQIVTAELVVQPGLNVQPIGRVIEVLGDFGDPGMEIEIALRKHELPFEFSPAAKELAARLPRAVRSADLKGRKDLRGAAARDDRRRDGEGFRRRGLLRAGRARAFAWWWRSPTSATTCAAATPSTTTRASGATRCTSRGASSRCCRRSSRTGCARSIRTWTGCAMVCDIAVGARGELGRYEFYPAVMRSHARLTYTQVAARSARPRRTSSRSSRPLVDRLKALDDVFRALLARARPSAVRSISRRSRREIVFDDHGKIARIVPRAAQRRAPADRGVHAGGERLRVRLPAAAAATPALYRVHEGPTPEKLRSAARVPEGLRPCARRRRRRRTPRTTRGCSSRVKHRPDVQLLQTVLLRSLQQAVYSPENVGHFGLAYEAYTHFTSPIRRYPDLLVHRAIKAVLAGERYDAGRLGASSGSTARRPSAAPTRRRATCEAWLKCYYMRTASARSSTGSISAVTASASSSRSTSVYVEGLVHISELGNDYFQFDRGAAPAARRAHSQGATGSATACASGSCASISS